MLLDIWEFLLFSQGHLSAPYMKRNVASTELLMLFSAK